MDNLVGLASKLFSPVENGGGFAMLILFTMAYGAIVFAAAFYFTVMLGMMISRALFGEEATNKASMVLLGFTALFTVTRFMKKG